MSLTCHCHAEIVVLVSLCVFELKCRELRFASLAALSLGFIDLVFGCENFSGCSSVFFKESLFK